MKILLCLLVIATGLVGGFEKQPSLSLQHAWLDDDSRRLDMWLNQPLDTLVSGRQGAMHILMNGSLLLQLQAPLAFSTQGDPHRLVLTLDMASMNSLRAGFDSTSVLEVELAGGTVRGMWDSTESLLKTELKFHPRVGTHPLEVHQASLDLHRNRLILFFNQDLVDSARKNDVSLSIGSWSDSSDTFTLSSGLKEISAHNDWVQVFSLPATLVSDLRVWTQERHDMNLSIPDGMFTARYDGTTIKNSRAIWLSLGNEGEVSAPRLDHAYLDPADSTLQLNFNMPLLDELPRTGSRIRLYQGFGTGSLDLSHPGQDGSPFDPRLSLRLSGSEMDTLGAWMQEKKVIVLTIDSAFVRDITDSRSNAALIRENGMHLEYPGFYGPRPMRLYHAGMDAHAGTLSLHFDRELDPDYLKPMRLRCSVDGGGPRTLTLQILQRLPSAYSNELKLRLDTAQLAELESWPERGSKLHLEMSSGLVRSKTDSSANAPLFFVNAFPIAYHNPYENHFEDPIHKDSTGRDFSPGVNILDRKGYWNTLELSILHEMDGVFERQLGRDTVALEWAPFRNEEIYSLSPGTQGRVQIFARYRAGDGSVGPWTIATTVIDTVAPMVVSGMDTAYTLENWPGKLYGEIRDSLSGPLGMKVSFVRLSDGYHFNGNEWSPSGDSGFEKMEGAWELPLSSENLQEGEAYLFTLVGIDRAGNAALPLSKRFSIFARQPPRIEVNVATSGAAMRATFGVKGVPDSIIPIFHYRLRRDGLQVDSGKGNEAQRTFFPLGDGSYTLFAYASDESEQNFTDSVSSAFTISGITKVVLDSARWRMMTMPQASLSTKALGSNISLAHWKDDASPDKLFNRYLTEEKLDSLRRGEGYWAYPDSRLEKSIPFTAYPTGDLEIDLIKGQLGWNQIGNPFPYRIDVRQAGLTFWRWNPKSNDMEMSRGLLEAATAYWVQVDSTRKLVLPAKPSFLVDTVRSTHPAVSKLAAGEWSLRLLLRAGDFQDGDNYMGMVPALARKSALTEPPRMGPHISLEFLPSGSDVGSATDFRAPAQESQWWDARITNQLTGEPRGILFLEGLVSLQASGRTLELYQDGRRVTFEGGQATISLAKTQSHLSIRVLPANGGPEVDPAQAFWLTNAPNPVSTMTQIRFTVPQMWLASGKRVTELQPVQIKLYRADGRQVGNLLRQELPAGIHTIGWQRSEGQTHLPAGTYFLRLQVGRHTTTRALQLTSGY